MKIGIVGLGFVGDAIEWSLGEKGVETVGYDKFKNGGIGCLEDILVCPIVFLCLPTLFKDDLNQYDKSALEEVCDGLRNLEYSGVVVVKSTVEPGVCQDLTNEYGLKIIHNPEFLTARTAREDFHGQSHIVLGKPDGVNNEAVDLLEVFYQDIFPDAEISRCSSVESESMKIYVNTFYAVKVQMFNEFYLLSQKTGAEYDVVKDLMLKNGWISPHHVNVPGPDGSLSYGGACFPKDTQALSSLMQSLGTPNGVLDACIKERNWMRREDL